MKLGLALPQYDYSVPGKSTIDWETVSSAAKEAEALGFDSLWLSDHLFLDIAKYGGDATRHSAMECLTTLAALSAVTDRVRLGSLVLCNDLRPPAVAAKMLTGLSVLSGGRLDAGIGAGWYEPDFEAAGLSFPSAKERVDRLSEAVQILRGMFRNERFSFKGKYYEIEDATNLPSPSVPPPVIVGGKGDRVVRIAARHADGYNAVWAWTPSSFGGRIAVLEREMERIGRAREEVAVSVGLYTLPGETEKDLESRWQSYVSATHPGVSEGVSFDQWRKDKLTGTPEQIAERVHAFDEIGVQEVILGFGLLPFQLADMEAVRFFMQDVPPLIRR